MTQSLTWSCVFVIVISILFIIELKPRVSHHAEITIHSSVITSMDVIIRSPTLQQPNTELKINQSLLNPKLGGDYSCLLVVYGTRTIADR